MLKKLLLVVFVSCFLFGCSSPKKVEKEISEVGDLVIIDFVGKVDGVAFDGGTATDYSYVLGSNLFIPGFEEQIIGMKKGEQRVIKVTFPEEYQSEEVAGKDATFDVVMKRIFKEVD